MKTLSLLLSTLLFTGAAIGAETHKLSAENTTIKFIGSKKDGKHEGTFKKVEGTLSIDPKAPEKGTVEVTIDIDSMTTDADKLTAHLKSPDFFDAKKYPQAKFVSKSIKAGTDKDSYTIAGELTMHGKKHTLSIPAKSVTADGKVTVSAQFDIKRSDWGMTFMKDKVNDEVQLTLEVKGPAK